MLGPSLRQTAVRFSRQVLLRQVAPGMQGISSASDGFQARAVSDGPAAESEGEKKTKRKVKAKKDPNEPKKPLTPYFRFAVEQRPKVLAENPDFKFTEVAKELGAQWKALSEADKAKYQQGMKEDMARYEEEKAAYAKSKDA